MDKIGILLFIILPVIQVTESKFITNKAFQMLEHFWRLGWPGFTNFGPDTFPHLKGVHINHHSWKERGHIIPFGLPIEGILERSYHPYHAIVKKIQPFSPVTTHLVGHHPPHPDDLSDRKSSSVGKLSKNPPVEGSLAGTIAKITAEAVSGADVHPTEDPMFPSPYDNSPAGPPTKDQMSQAVHHHFTHNRLYHNQRNPTLYFPNEMFQGQLEFKPLGIYSGGKYTWDPNIFDRHFDRTFDYTKLSSPMEIHSSEAAAQADGLLNRNKGQSGSVLPSKIHAKHVPSNLNGDGENLFNNFIDQWNDDSDPVSSDQPMSMAEDIEPNEDLSFLDELSFIVANEPHHHLIK